MRSIRIRALLLGVLLLALAAAHEVRGADPAPYCDALSPVAHARLDQSFPSAVNVGDGQASLSAQVRPWA